MEAFMQHFCLTAFSGEAWFDWDKELAPQLLEHEAGEVFWSYDQKTKQILCEDVVSILQGKPNENIRKWVSYVLNYIDDNPDTVNETSALMSSMGCGSSDILLPSKVQTYARAHKICKQEMHFESNSESQEADSGADSE